MITTTWTASRTKSAAGSRRGWEKLFPLARGQPIRRCSPVGTKTGDFISDFNQNDTPTRRNAVADYEEPFLRFNVDRPEFLFGMDMNNNGWIDRFEDDADPDYPYDRNLRGYNVYGGVDVAPEVRLTVGQTRQWQLSSKRRSEAAYGLFTLEQDWPGLGRLRVFEHLKNVRDNIADDRLAASQAIGAQQAVVEDPLAAQNTWNQHRVAGVRLHRPAITAGNQQIQVRDLAPARRAAAAQRARGPPRRALCGRGQ